MNDTQIQFVQTSFAKVVPIREAAAEVFYADLFDSFPEVKSYFAQTDMSQQGGKLMAALAIVVHGLRDMEKILPVVEALAKRHVAYGVKAEDYDKVGSALLRTLQKGLGEAFTTEVSEAWSAVYGVLASAMIEAAYARA